MGKLGLCRVFSTKTHGKVHTAEFCTVNDLCCAFFIDTHGEPLSCVNVAAQQTFLK
jgi:hypothetical protein